MENTSPKSDFLIKVFTEHPTIAFTLIYIYFSAIGMIYNFGYYSDFNINIFHWMKLTDFLLSALKQPFVLIVATAINAGILIFLYRNKDIYLTPPTKIFWLRVFYYIFVSLIPLMCIFGPAFFISQRDAGKVIVGHTLIKAVSVKTVTDADSSINKNDTFYVIGSTDEYLFLFDRVKNRSVVLKSDKVDAVIYHQSVIYGDSINKRNSTSYK